MFRIKDQQKKRKISINFGSFIFFRPVYCFAFYVSTRIRTFQINEIRYTQHCRQILSAHKFCDYLIVLDFMDFMSRYLADGRGCQKQINEIRSVCKIRYKSKIIFLLLLSFVAVKEECVQKDLHWDLSLLFDDTRVPFFIFVHTWFHLCAWLPLPFRFTL